jgi:hypothetical protein
MSVFLLLGAALSLRARPSRLQEAGPGWRGATTERHHGSGHPQRHGLANQKRSPSVRRVNWTLVYGNPATELPLLVERFFVARCPYGSPGLIGTPQTSAPPTMLTGPIRSLTWTWPAAAVERKWSDRDQNDTIDLREPPPRLISEFPNFT